MLFKNSVEICKEMSKMQIEKRKESKEKRSFPIYLLRKSRIKAIAQTYYNSAGIFKEFIGARNRVGIGLSYRPARIHRLAELILWNQFLGSLNV